mmetsp:Transcript_69858/g.116023  ORF Transcript_69858/g.116023 Transcript_69858/m.116023 type:complete len:130 (+) Transcript_69858:59-448(+)|eukprot:CAMPEP_0119341714 /NCGR_PEP_ID=MMETSP1333-20130426/103078_1 /TAXON_ID=418940 /ORGANISM="Scyphosphaera apsteinii, Strain RCC1455" /LENGTH=129 /DNA_ID=CAMNT_0007353761 /DNA_START=54 /DNA_END=443 /DNA_ORIENTATION=+
MTLDGVRYLQAPLSYPRERKDRLGTVALGTDFPHGKPAVPVLVYDAVARSFPPRYDAGWSNFYARYPRRPDLCHLLAPRAAARYKQVEGKGMVGYFEEADYTRGEPSPAYKLGPSNAVDPQLNQHEVSA